MLGPIPAGVISYALSLMWMLISQKSLEVLHFCQWKGFYQRLMQLLYRERSLET